MEDRCVHWIRLTKLGTTCGKAATPHFIFANCATVNFRRTIMLHGGNAPCGTLSASHVENSTNDDRNTNRKQADM
jgi:hypothetical protein